MKAYSLRLWPNGEFGMGFYRKMEVRPLPVGSQPERPESYSWTKTELYTWVVEMVKRGFDPSQVLSALPESQRKTLRRMPELGLSNVSKTHKPLKRGVKGLTSYGKKMLRNGCWLLEKAAGVRSVGMFTGTIPPCHRDQEIEIVNNWGEIMRIFTQWLHRRLKAVSPQPWVIGCVEVQEKRQAKYGGLPLHCHLVFRSRVGKEHIVQKGEFCKAWKRAVVSCVPSAEYLNFDASTRVEQCKKSVASYLSKYMSKGVTSNVGRNLDPRFEFPSTWWYGVGKFKQHIKRLMTYETGEIAAYIWQGANPLHKHFIYAGNVLNEHDGLSFVVGVYGKVSNSLRSAIQSRDSRRVLELLDAV